MYLGEILSKIFQFLFIILLTRYLGAEGYGKISFALALGWIIVAFSDFGINHIAFREMSARNDKIIQHASKSLSLKMIFGTMTLVVSVILMSILDFNREKMIILGIICVSFIIDSIAQIFRNALISTKNMAYESVVKIVFGSSKLALLLILQYFGASLISITTTYFFSSIITLIVAFLFFKKNIGVFKVSMDRSYSIWMLKESYPLLFGSIFTMILFGADVILLGWLKGDYPAGIYSAPSRLIMTGFIFSEILIASVYPYCVTYFKDDKKILVKLIQLTTCFSFLIFIPIILVSIIFPERIVIFIFGNDFAAGAIVLRIFSFVLFFYHFTSWYGALFIIARRVKMNSAITFAATIANVILNYFLIKEYSFVGAAVATIISYGIFAALQHLFFNKFSLRIPLASKLIRLTFLFVIMAAMTYSLKSLSLILIGLMFLPTYILLIFLLKIFTYDEIALLVKATNFQVSTKKIKNAFRILTR